MEYSSRRNWPFQLALLAVAVVFFGYVLVWPLMTACFEPTVSSGAVRFDPPPVVDQVRMRLFEAVIAGWFFLFGASLGSFLNVVVYRTPRKLSLMGSSFCPKCGHTIRWYDNVPVFGWLSLRGRCRDCHLRIAARYPLVELALGLMVLAVAVAELFLGGASLPGERVSSYSSVSWLVMRTQWGLVATFAYHVGLLFVLLSWALIRWDGHPLPKAYVLLAFGFAVAFPAYAPSVQPVPWVSPRPEWLTGCTWCWRFDTTVVGVLVGGLLGMLQAVVSRVWRPSGRSELPMTFDLTAMLALIGAVLGWQAAVSTFLLAASGRVIVSTVTGGFLSRDSSVPWISLLTATLFQILAWNALDNLSGWPGSKTTLASAVALVLLATYFAFVASYVECRRGAE